MGSGCKIMERGILLAVWYNQRKGIKFRFREVQNWNVL